MKNKVLGRRCIAISLAAALSAGLTACGSTGGDTQAATTETTQITETAQTAERIYLLRKRMKIRSLRWRVSRNPLTGFHLTFKLGCKNR